MCACLHLLLPLFHCEFSSVYDSTDFPLFMLYASCTFYFHFYYCAAAVPHIITAWLQQPCAFSPFYLLLLHIVLFLHVLLPFCVWPCFIFFPLSLFLPFPSTIPVMFYAFFHCLVPLACFSTFVSPFAFIMFCYFFLVWTPFFYLLCQPAPLLSSLLHPLRVSILFCLCFRFLLGCLSTLWISEPVVACTVHPPASHSAPSFLRQYAGHLGRTALRREPGGGLERDRAFLSLHRTGSLGICTHTDWHMDTTVIT